MQPDARTAPAPFRTRADLRLPTRCARVPGIGRACVRTLVSGLFGLSSVCLACSSRLHSGTGGAMLVWTRPGLSGLLLIALTVACTATPAATPTSPAQPAAPAQPSATPAAASP